MVTVVWFRKGQRLETYFSSRQDCQWLIDHCKQRFYAYAIWEEGKQID